jgi:hypothetical protein
MLHNKREVMFRGKQILAATILCLLSVFGFTADVSAGAQQSSSNNYGVSEVNFGSGGDVHVCSNNYCSKQSAGELTVGNTSSNTYQAQAGFNTNREELLEVSVTGGGINLGTLDATAVKSGSIGFSIRNYLASGYVVLLAGQAPTSSSGHVITAMSSADISRPGTEQFGVNLRSNTSPTVGADPVQVPDSTFSFGAAAAGYNTQNNFKFVSGDTVASSPKSSGETDYTLSVIENITSNTAAGQYAGNLNVIAVSTF